VLRGQLRDDIGVAEGGRRGEGRAAKHVDGRRVRGVAEEEERHHPRISLEGGQVQRRLPVPVGSVDVNGRGCCHGGGGRGSVGGCASGFHAPRQQVAEEEGSCGQQATARREVQRRLAALVPSARFGACLQQRPNHHTVPAGARRQ